MTLAEILPTLTPPPQVNSRSGCRFFTLHSVCVRINLARFTILHTSTTGKDATASDRDSRLAPRPHSFLVTRSVGRRVRDPRLRCKTASPVQVHWARLWETGVHKAVTPAKATDGRQKLDQRSRSEPPDPESEHDLLRVCTPLLRSHWTNNLFCRVPSRYNDELMKRVWQYETPSLTNPSR